MYLLHKNIFPHKTLYSTEIKSSASAYTSRPYSEALAMQPSVSQIMYGTSSHKLTGDIINFAHFEEGDLVGDESNIV